MAKITRSSNKIVPRKASVAGPLASVENRRRQRDCQEIMHIMRQETTEPSVMWGTSIIGFGLYYYVYDSGREGDMPLVGWPRASNR